MSIKKVERSDYKKAWSKNKPSLSHYRVFDLTYYKHVFNQLRRKLDDKGEEMTLLGYHQTRGYKLLNLTSKQILYVEMSYFVNQEDKIGSQVQMMDAILFS